MDKEKRLTPIKAIRAKCLECSVDNNAEVRNCVIPSCPLYPYRMGHNPYIKMSEERKAKMAENFARKPQERGQADTEHPEEV